MSELGLLEEALIPKARSEVSAGRQGLETQLYRVQWTSEGRKDKDLLSCLGEIVDGIVTNLFCCSMLQPCHLDILPELAVSPLPPHTHTNAHTQRNKRGGWLEFQEDVMPCESQHCCCSPT